MKTIRPKHYYCELFQANVWFYLGSSVESTRKHLKKFWAFDPTLIDEYHLGKTIEFQNESGARCIVIWTKHPLSDKRIYPTLAHECVHATNMIMDRAGVQSSYLNDETHAHMVGLLMKKAAE